VIGSKLESLIQLDQKAGPPQVIDVAEEPTTAGQATPEKAR
jgi:hypothetical protein